MAAPQDDGAAQNGFDQADVAAQKDDVAGQNRISSPKSHVCLPIIKYLLTWLKTVICTGEAHKTCEETQRMVTTRNDQNAMIDNFEADAHAAQCTVDSRTKYYEFVHSH